MKPEMLSMTEEGLVEKDEWEVDSVWRCKGSEEQWSAPCS